MLRNKRKDRSIEIFKKFKTVELPAWFDIEKSPPPPKKNHRYVGTFEVSHPPKWIA